MSNQCGEVLHGNGLVFCNSTGNRKLSTTALNTTTASVLQFSIGEDAIQHFCHCHIRLILLQHTGAIVYVYLEDCIVVHT